MNERVVLREFSSRTDAEIVRELLEANGIEGFVISDDCGAVDPALQFARGALLLVDARDWLTAEQIVSESRDDTLEETPEDDPEP